VIYLSFSSCCLLSVYTCPYLFAGVKAQVKWAFVDLAFVLFLNAGENKNGARMLNGVLHFILGSFSRLLASNSVHVKLRKGGGVVTGG